MALRSNDRILVLEKTDPKADAGLLDPRVFEGKNNLHAVMDTGNCMWNFRYEHGAIPPGLRGKFTSFKEAMSHAELYLVGKKIKIVNVLD